MYDILIIGAGPAGLTAAIYAQRAGRKTLVLEANTYGGQIIEAPKIENYPAEPNISGVELAQKLYKQATDLGAEIEFEKVENIERDGDHFVVTTDDSKRKAKTVIIATGTQNRRLHLPNEDELIGHGISFCATCDGSLYKDKAVAVAGGGNSAIDDVLYLANIAKKVYIIHRRNEFRADPADVKKMRALENVEEVLGANIIELLGDKSLESIKVKQGDNERTIDCNALFLAVGREAASDFAKTLNIKTADGYLEANESCTTNVPGIFTAGDVRTKELRQLVTATSDGAIAANAASKYIDSLTQIDGDILFNICYVLNELGPISEEYLGRILKTDCAQALDTLRKLHILMPGDKLNLAIDSLDKLPFTGDHTEAAKLVNKAREDRKQIFPGETKIA